MIASTNLEKPKVLNLKTDKPQIFSGDLTNIWGIWKQIFHALFKSLVGWFWFLIVLNFYILVKKAQKHLTKVIYMIQSGWQESEDTGKFACLRSLSLGKQFLLASKNSTLEFLSVSVKEKVYTWILFTLTL